VKLDKIDALVLTIAGFFGLLLIGMLFDVWQLAFYPIPPLAVVLLALGSLNKRDEWGPTMLPVALFGGVLTALWIWMGLTMFDEGRLGGMQTALGVLYYFIWPFITVFSGVLYALVYSSWLKRDVDTAAVGH
jgi:hypothetical protein